MSDLADARRWLRQADADLATARHNAVPHPYAACFFAQQAAEKAVKAVQIAATGMLPRTHSVGRLLDLAKDLTRGFAAATERRLGAQLDRLYTETRYPDALPDTIPAEYFTPEDAQGAIADAQQIVDAAAAALPPAPPGEEPGPAT